MIRETTAEFCRSLICFCGDNKQYDFRFFGEFGLPSRDPRLVKLTYFLPLNFEKKKYSLIIYEILKILFLKKFWGYFYIKNILEPLIFYIVIFKTGI